jgi:hypothetical protein
VCVPISAWLHSSLSILSFRQSFSVRKSAPMYALCVHIVSIYTAVAPYLTSCHSPAVAGKNDWYRLHRYLEIGLLQRKEREQGESEGSCAAPAPSTSASVGSKKGGEEGEGEGEGNNALKDATLKREREEMGGSEGGDRQEEDSSSLLTGQCVQNQHYFTRCPSSSSSSPSSSTISPIVLYASASMLGVVLIYSSVLPIYLSAIPPPLCFSHSNSSPILSLHTYLF